MASNSLDDQDERAGRAHGSPLSSLSPSPVKGSRVARMNPSKNLNSNSPSRSTLQSPNLKRKRERDPQEKLHIQEKQRSDALKKAQEKADRLRSKDGSKKSNGDAVNGVTTVQSHKGKEKEKVAENGNGKDRERESNPVKAATTSTSRSASAINKGKGKEKAVEPIPATSFYSKPKPQISSSPSHPPPPGPTRQRRPPRSPKRKIRPSKSSTPEIPLDSSEAEDNDAGGVGGGPARKSRSPIVDSSPSEKVLPPVAKSRNNDNLKVDDTSRKNKLQPLSTSNPLRNPVVDSKNQPLSLSKPTTSTNLTPQPQPQTTTDELPTSKTSTSTLKVPSKPSTSTTRKYKNPNEPRKRGERAMTRSASARLNSGSSDAALSSPIVNDRAVKKKKEEEREKVPPRKRKEREGEDEVGRNVKGKSSKMPSSKSREILPNSEIVTDSRVRENSSTSTGKNQSNVDPKVVGTSRQALNTRNSVNLSTSKDQTRSNSRTSTVPVSDRRKENRGTNTPEPQSRPQQSEVNKEVEPESIVLDSMPGEADDDSQSFPSQGQHRLRDQDDEMIKIPELKQEKEKADEAMKQSSPSPSRSGPESSSESESESEDEEAFSQFVDENSMDPLDLLPNKKDLRSSSRIGRRTGEEVPKGGGSKGKGKEEERVVDQDQETKKGETSRRNSTRGKSNESRAGELRQVNQVGKNGNLQRGSNNQIRIQKKPNQVDESKEKMSESEASDNDDPMDQVQKSQSLSSSIHQSPSPVQNSSNTSASVENQDVQSSPTCQTANRSKHQAGVSPRKEKPRNSNKPTYDELPFLEIEEVHEIRVIPVNARNGNRDQSPSLSSSLTTPEPNVASKVDPRFWISKMYPEQIHAFEINDRTYTFKSLPPSRSQVIREVEEMDSQDQSSVGRRNVVKSENGVRKVMAWTAFGQEDPENVEDEPLDPESLRWRD